MKIGGATVPQCLQVSPYCCVALKKASWNVIQQKERKVKQKKTWEKNIKGKVKKTTNNIKMNTGKI